MASYSARDRRPQTYTSYFAHHSQSIRDSHELSQLFEVLFETLTRRELYTHARRCRSSRGPVRDRVAVGDRRFNTRLYVDVSRRNVPYFYCVCF